MDSLRHISDLLGLGPGPVRVLAGVGLVLVGATVARAARLWLRPSELSRTRWRSLGTWWVLLALFVGMLALGRPGVAAVMALAALLAFRESWALAAPGRRLLAAAVALVGPAFVAAVAWLPAPFAHPGTRLGWLVLLLVLTELNDVAQAFWGRTLGRFRMAPQLSPKKTWEGFWGGIVTTTAVAAFIAPYLTDYGQTAPPAAAGLAAPAWLWPALVGLVVAVAGVAGDLLASRLKRQAGVKDSGRLLPGQGGVLDRLDSLTVAAPAFWALTWLLWVLP